MSPTDPGVPPQDELRCACGRVAGMDGLCPVHRDTLTVMRDSLRDALAAKYAKRRRRSRGPAD